MSLYRTHRPQTLGQLIGQEHIRQGFLGALSKGQLAHAYLFTGPRGTGKTSTARIIARAINCENPAADGEPCNSCALCTDALASRLTDLIEIDAASNRGIDEIRELKETISFAPSRGKAKVYIIDEVHMLTKEAFNALLKTLEEPPAHAYFILATTEIHKVPETIISRCQRFDFHRIRDDDMTTHLAAVAKQEGIAAEADALALIARQSAGGLRDALSLLDQLAAGGAVSVASVAATLGLSRPVAVEDFVDALLEHRTVDALATIDGLVAEGANLVQFNRAVLMQLRELMLVDVAAGQLTSATHLISLIEAFTRAGDDLKTALIPQLPLETAAVLVTAGKVAHGTENTEQKKEIQKEVRAELEKNEPKPIQETRGTERGAENTEQKKEIQAESEKQDFSEADARRAFAAAQKNVRHTPTKMAFKEARFMAFSHGEITAGVASDFYLATLTSPEARAAIATAFADDDAAALHISFVRTEVSDLPSPPPASPPAKKIAAAPVDLARHAEDLFADDNTF